MTFRSEVFDLSFKGLGVVRRDDGKKFFVPGVWPGDLGDFAVTSEEKKFGFARLMKLVQPSRDRVDVICPHFGFQAGQCGGCSWLMVNYSAQLSAKEKILEDQYRFSGLPMIAAGISPIVSADRTMGYRTRAQLKTDGKSLGYVTPQSKDLAPIKDCLVLTEHNRGLLRDLQKNFRQLCEPVENSYKFQFFDIDEELNSSGIEVNVRRPFRQGHAEQNLKMKAILREWCRATEVNGQTVLELFCGSGNFTEDLCSIEDVQVLAIEGHAAAVTQLKKRNWSNVDAQVADLFRAQSIGRFKDQMCEVQTLVLDPPREGFLHLPLWVQSMPKLEQIFYISCDLQTFLRDVKAIQPMGWSIEQLVPVDLYPQTPHLELMGRLRRKKNGMKLSDKSF